MAGLRDEQALDGAARRFPGRASEILTRAWRDPALLDMCQELAAAEAALAHTDALPAELQAERREECGDGSKG